MALGDISGLLEPLIVKASEMGGAFVPMGLTFLALAITLTILFAVYEWWLGGVSGASAKLVHAGLVMVIPLTLLAGGWTGHMKTFTNFFSQEMTAPIMSVSGAGSGPDAVKTAITKLTSSMFPNARAVEAGGTPKTAWDTIRDVVTGEESLGGAMFSALTSAFFEMLLFFIAIVVSMALLFALYGPLIALQIGVIFGPLLIAWMPFKPLAHLSQAWFRFMLANGAALVVGITMAVLGAGVISDYSDQMAMMGKDENLSWAAELGAKFGGFMASTAVIIFVAFMLFRADDLASAMIGGGGAGAGGIGGAIMSRIAATRSPQMKPQGPQGPRSPGGPPRPPGGGGGGGGGGPKPP